MQIPLLMGLMICVMIFLAISFLMPSTQPNGQVD